MDAKDFKRFMDELYVTFPSVYEYVKFNSIDVSKTHKAWMEILDHVSYGEAMSILAEWKQSPTEPFQNSQRGMIPHLIRTRVGFERDKLNKLKTRQNEFSSVEARRRSYTPIAGLSELYEVALEANRLLAQGAMTEQQWEMVRDDLVEQAGKTGLSEVVNPIPRILAQRAG